MASDDPSSDPFRVRLNWPEQDLVPATRRDQQGDAEPDDGGGAPADPTFAYEPDDDGGAVGGSVLFTIASRLEGLRAALGNIAVRLDSLIRREEQFREFTTSRLAENAEQVALAVGSTRHAIEDQNREQGRVTDMLEMLREDLAAMRAEIMESIAQTEARDEELAVEVARLVEEVRVLRRRMTVRARPVSGRGREDDAPDQENFAPRGRLRRRPE